MSRIMHISDLHCGRSFVPEVGEALLRAADTVQPDFLIASGDLVEWAERAEQWRAARVFLERFGRPFLAVAGNHDIDRVDLIGRWRAPYRHYRRYIHPDLDRTVSLPGVTVVGLATPKRWTLELGHLSAAQLEYAAESFTTAPAGHLRIVVVHHPLRQLKRLPIRDHMRGNLRAIAAFQRLGVDLALTGHKHWPHVERVELFETGDGGLIWSQAGTATTKRFRPFHLNTQSFSVIDADLEDTSKVTPHHRIVIRPWCYERSSGEFRPAEAENFTRPRRAPGL